MTEETQTQANELDVLKERARVMGITFSNNIGVDALRKKIADKLSDEPTDETSEEEEVDETESEVEGNDDEETEVVAADEVEPEVEVEQAPNPLVQATEAPAAAPAAPAKKLTKAEQKAALRREIIAEQTKLVRLRITNLDPKKKDLPGEILTVANEYMGTIRKYVPYGEVTDNGYHVPYCLYQMLDSRRFLDIKTTRDRRTGQITTKTQWVKEFALEILPPLTEEELARLANQQAAAGSIGD